MVSRVLSRVQFSSKKETSSARKGKVMKRSDSCGCGKKVRTRSSFTLIEKGLPSSSKRKADKNHLTDVQWVDKIPECPVFYPSAEEFEDPLVYLQQISPEASKFGICKIVSPLKASASASDVLMKEKRGFEFRTYLQPLCLSGWNVNGKGTYYAGESNYTFKTFEKRANKEYAQRFPGSRSLSPPHLEKKFWQAMTNGNQGMVEYGVNVEGSAFSSDPNDQLGQSKWNLKTLPQLPQSALRLIGYPIPGITDPMLYIGMIFSMFAWHVEDHYLYSINYHHSGAPKTWYCVPGGAAPEFEKVALDHVYAPESLHNGDDIDASEILSEKTTMFPPGILLQHNVPVYRAVQKPGEFVVTFPRSYHAGFSHGFNCGEAVNFAVKDWFPWGAVAGYHYATLGKMVVLPYEELLCKEAILLSDLASESSVKNCFAQHIGFLQNALRNLIDLNATSSPSPESQGTILCHLCKRDCYLMFIECSSCYHHMCLFHDVKSVGCSCSGTRVVFIREDIQKVEDMYRKLYEQEEEECLSH
ncbi:hypothetical protein SLEP1_g17575 [Rubroshorea leprosula]|uniref:Lysine-specific demethylase JMJ706-like n=1 Tax=Rubroshorea leprosula TaxID=152421 RepID=A0AAV5J3R6_9ROSI|nr:hypothetical protein SLEP1_g17575 [Rubroshorea leprosula]